MIDNYNELKQLRKSEVLAAIKQLCPEFEFKTKPWMQQAVCLLAAMLEEDGFLSALDLGTGKTKVAIDFCRYLEIRDKLQHFKGFVVCLNSAMYNWKQEVEMHSDFTACVLDGSTEERREKLETVNANIFIVNFESFRYLFSTKKQVKWDEEKDKPVMKLKPDHKKLKYFWDNKLKESPVDCFIVDESHMLKNIHSLTYRLIKTISGLVDIEKIILLTGTPFGNTPLDIWSQYFIIDKGKTFEKKITTFKKKYFKDVGWFGQDWKVTKEGTIEIEKLIWSKAIRYSEEEVEALPPKVYRTIEYRLSKEQRKAYIDFYGHVKEMKKMDEIINAHSAFKQICSGFLGVKGQKVFKQNSKYDAISELLDQMIDRSKIVFFHWFTWEYKLLAELLKKKKITFAYLNGSTGDSKAKWKMQEQFKNSNKCRAMIAQTKVGGASINMTSATYCAFVSNHGSVIDRKQAEKRIHRGGQDKTCFFYDFVGKGTVEVKVNKDLQKGINMFENIVNADQLKKSLINLKEL